MDFPSAANVTSTRLPFWRRASITETKVLWWLFHLRQYSCTPLLGPILKHWCCNYIHYSKVLYLENSSKARQVILLRCFKRMREKTKTMGCGSTTQSPWTVWPLTRVVNNKRGEINKLPLLVWSLERPAADANRRRVENLNEGSKMWNEYLLLKVLTTCRIIPLSKMATSTTPKAQNCFRSVAQRQSAGAVSS